MSTHRPSALYTQLLNQLDSGSIKLASIDTDNLQQLLHECSTLQHAAKQQAEYVSEQLRGCYGGNDGIDTVSELDDQKWYMNCMQIVYGTDMETIQQPVNQNSISSDSNSNIHPNNSNHTNDSVITNAHIVTTNSSNVSSKSSAVISHHSAKGKQPASKHAHLTSDRTAVNDTAVYSKPRGRGTGSRAQAGVDADADATDTDDDSDDITYVKRDKPRRSKEDEKQQEKINQLNSFWKHIDQCMAFPSQSHIDILQLEHTDKQSDPMYIIPEINTQLQSTLHTHISVKQALPNTKSKQSKLIETADDQSLQFPVTDTADSLFTTTTDTSSATPTQPTTPVPVSTQSRAFDVGSGGKKKSAPVKVAAKDLRIVGIHDSKIKRQVNELDRTLADAIGPDVNKMYSYTRHNVSQRLLSVFVSDSSQPSSSYNPFAFTKLLMNHVNGKSKAKRKKSDNIESITFDERVRMELQSLQILPQDIDTHIRSRQDDEISTELRRYQAKLKQSRKQSHLYKLHLLPLSTQLMPRAQLYDGLMNIQHKINKFNKTKRRKTIDANQLSSTLSQYNKYKHTYGDRASITGYYVDQSFTRGIPDIVARSRPAAPSYWQAILGINDPYANDNNIKLEQNNITLSPVITQPAPIKQLSPVSVFHATPAVNLTPLYNVTLHSHPNSSTTPSPSLHVTYTPADIDRCNASPMNIRLAEGNSSDDIVMRDLLNNSNDNDEQWFTAPSIGKLNNQSIVSDLDLGFDPF